MNVKRAARATHYLIRFEIAAGHIRDVEAAGRPGVDIDASRRISVSAALEPRIDTSV